MPLRLQVQAVPVQADELHPPLIGKHIRLLALLEVLIADPELPALSCTPYSSSTNSRTTVAATENWLRSTSSDSAGTNGWNIPEGMTW